MARGINKVILVGNLGADPQVRYTPPPDSIAIANFNIATSRSWKNKQTGQQEEQTEWHRVVFYNRLAEIAGEYLRKGAKVYIEGSLRTRKWKDSNEIERTTTEIIGSELQMLDGRGSNAPANMEEGQSSRFTPNQQHAATTPQHETSSAGTSSSSTDFDDDIPF